MRAVNSPSCFLSSTGRDAVGCSMQACNMVHSQVLCVYRWPPTPRVWMYESDIEAPKRSDFLHHFAKRSCLLCRHRYEISRLEVAEGAHDKVMQAAYALQMMCMFVRCQHRSVRHRAWVTVSTIAPSRKQAPCTYRRCIGGGGARRRCQRQQCAPLAHRFRRSTWQTCSSRSPGPTFRCGLLQPVLALLLAMSPSTVTARRQHSG